jgi:hypothetical protein
MNVIYKPFSILRIFQPSLNIDQQAAAGRRFAAVIHIKKGAKVWLKQ